MSLKLNRKSSDAASFTFAIATDVDLSNEVCIDGYSFGILYLPSNFDGTDLIFHVSATKSGTYVPVSDPITGTDITYKTAASKACPIPPEAFGAAWLKLESVTDQATSDTVVTATFKG